MIEPIEKPHAWDERGTEYEYWKIENIPDYFSDLYKKMNEIIEEINRLTNPGE